MDIVKDAVKKLESLLEHSGCCDSGVVLDVDPGMVNCRYERGACMTAEFGGKRGVFTTFDPIRGCTKISFMFGAPLNTPNVRGAACAIINMASGFFCLARTLRPCEGSQHGACGRELASLLHGSRVFSCGAIHSLDSVSGLHLSDDPSSADIILIGAEGCLDPQAGDLIHNYQTTKKILLVGPSTAGTARLNQLEHWCPFGKS